MSDEQPVPSSASFPTASSSTAGPSPFSHETPLECGTEPVDLLAQVCDGDSARLSPHQDQCPHCRQTLAGYARLWAPFDELAAEPVRAPHGLVERAMSYVREIATDPVTTLLPLDGHPDPLPPGAPCAPVPGQSWVGARVVIRSARLAAQGVSGVRLALSHLDVVPGPARSVSVDADPPAQDDDPADRRGVIVLEMTVAADYGRDLQDLSRRIRTEVTERVEAQTGVRPMSVSVHVDDVFPARH